MDYLDDIDALRLRALRSVWKPDYDSSLRRIFRWYSEKFHTPLHEVPDLPLHDVLQAYFEVAFEGLAPEERHNTAMGLLETPDEKRAREIDDKASEDSFIEMTEQLVKKQAAGAALSKKASEVTGLFSKIANKLVKREVKESEEEELSVSYSDDELTDGVPFGPPKK